MDADRAAANAFHGMLPLIFDGTAQTVTLAAWLHDMEAIFRIGHIGAHLQVPLASRCLARDARLWWRYIGEPALLGGSWEEFRTLIIERYGPILEKDVTIPYRDPAIYNNMNFERYLNYAADWHAYPGESMSHYCRRFQEAMLPYIPNIGEPGMKALQLLRKGVPPEIRTFVQVPVAGMMLETMINDIMEAEATVHMLHVDALVNDNGEEPVDDIGLGEPPFHGGPVIPEDPIPAIPLQEIPPHEVGIDAEADDIPDDHEPFEDPPEINVEVNNEEEEWEEQEGGDEQDEDEEDDDDPEEVLFGDEEWDVFSDVTTE